MASKEQKFKPYRSLSGDLTGNLEHFVVSNGALVTEGHCVRLGSVVNLPAGYLAVAGVGNSILGVAAETVKGDGTKKAGIFCDPNILYKNDADGDFAQIDIGKHCDLTLSCRVDASTKTQGTAQLLLWEYNIESDASVGLFKIYESQIKP